jgi:acetyl-CoA carboxylase carboxyl transferase subunit alpha
MDKPEDFYTLEKPIMALKEQIDALLLAGEPGFKEKVAELRTRIEAEWAGIQPGLAPIQIVQVARHPKRPMTLDYIGALTADFLEMHGDRRFADDPALVAGLAFYKGQTVAVMGHQKAGRPASVLTATSAR